MSEKGRSRRKFLKYAGVGVVAAAAGIGYLTRGYWSPSVPNPTTQSPTFLPTETPTIKPLKAAFDYSPKYRYILQDPSQTIEFKNLTEYLGDTPACQWTVDNQIVSKDWDFATKFSPGKHTITLTTRDGKTSDWHSEDIEVDEYGPNYKEIELNVSAKGVLCFLGIRNWNQPPPI